VYAVVDLHGAVTGVSLCSSVVDMTQSGSATISHSLMTALTLTDVQPVDVSCEHAVTSVHVSNDPTDTDDVMPPASASVCFVIFSCHECVINFFAASMLLPTVISLDVN